MKQAIIMAPGGQQLWDGSNVSRIVLGEADHCLLIRIGNNWRVLSRGDRWQRVGSENPGGIQGVNQIWANGQSILETTIPSLADYLDYLETTDLAGSILSPGAWAGSNKLQWGRGGGTIYVPDLRGWFARNLDMGKGKDEDRQTAGLGYRLNSEQSNQNKAHNHTNGDYDELLKNDGQSTIVNTDNTPGQPNLSSSQPMVSNGGYEARPENYARPITFWI